MVETHTLVVADREHRDVVLVQQPPDWLCVTAVQRAVGEPDGLAGGVGVVECDERGVDGLGNVDA